MRSIIIFFFSDCNFCFCCFLFEVQQKNSIGALKDTYIPFPIGNFKGIGDRLFDDIGILR